MVIGRIRDFFAERKRQKVHRRSEKEQAETFRETEEMRSAESLKKEADRQDGHRGVREGPRGLSLQGG